jgi:hypothetical protein
VGFRHADEINAQMAAAGNAPFVTLDDDVVVSGDWLPAMQEQLRPDVSVVACSVYRDDSTLWSTGWTCDNTGRPINYKNPIADHTPMPAACSCCWLINSEYGNAFVPDVYEKYYFDPHHCFLQWLKYGLQTMVIPHKVIHVGGTSTPEKKVALERDRNTFCNYWIKTGRLEKLRSEYSDKWRSDLQWR